MFQSALWGQSMIRSGASSTPTPGGDRPALYGLDSDVGTAECSKSPGRAGPARPAQKGLVGLLNDYEGGVRILEGEVQILEKEVEEWDRDLYTRIGGSAETLNLYRKLTGQENLEPRLPVRGCGPRCERAARSVSRDFPPDPQDK